MGTLISWSDSLSVGVHALDSDHKLLFSLIGQLEDALDAGEGPETTGSLLNALVDYTDYHFGREEAIMRACGYPRLEEHISQHRRVAGELIRIRDAYLAKPEDGLSDGARAFLRQWLQDHVSDSDQDYAASLRGKEALIREASDRFAVQSLYGTDIIDFE